MELALIRHTRCDVASGTCYGHLDVPLANTAAADIELTLSRVPHVDVVFSSPSRRCHSLAQAIATRDACEIRMREDLRELSFGSWEGLRWDDIPRALSDPWAADPWNNAPPDGESESQLWQRAARVADELLQLAAMARAMRADRNDGEQAPPSERGAAIVSHGGPLRHLRCLLTRTPASERWRWSIECGDVALIAPRGSACRSSDP